MRVEMRYSETLQLKLKSSQSSQFLYNLHRIFTILLNKKTKQKKLRKSKFDNMLLQCIEFGTWTNRVGAPTQMYRNIVLAYQSANSASLPKEISLIFRSRWWNYCYWGKTGFKVLWKKKFKQYRCCQTRWWCYQSIREANWRTSRR